jgi:hypothetical protein
MSQFTARSPAQQDYDVIIVGSGPMIWSGCKNVRTNPGATLRRKGMMT